MKLHYKTTVELERSLVDAFKEIYTQRGAMKTFFNSCLKKFVEIHDHDLDREIGITVEGAIEDLKEEEED